MEMEMEMWRFETARFAVVWTISDCYDLDLSWDESGEVAEKLESGEYQAFDSAVTVYLDGREIAADYLGQSIYADPADFRDHVGLSKRATADKARADIRAAKAAFRERSAYLLAKYRAGEIGRRYYNDSMVDARRAIRGAAETYRRKTDYVKGSGQGGSYFSDMVRTAVADARREVERMKSLEMRAA